MRLIWPERFTEEEMGHLLATRPRLVLRDEEGRWWLYRDVSNHEGIKLLSEGWEQVEAPDERPAAGPEHA